MVHILTLQNVPTNAYTLGGKRLSRYAASACFQKCIVANNHRHLLAFWLVLALPSQRVANPRSVHTAASVPSHWGDTALPGLACGTPGSLIGSCISLTPPPSCPPSLHGRYPLHRYYEDSDSGPATFRTRTGILGSPACAAGHSVSTH